MQMATDGSQDTVWVFGYGSLTWKANFPYHERVVGHVKGYARRFWQGSTDHRGVPGAPGRVVTLIAAKEEVTWGVAFRAHPSVLSYLDHREKGGYTTHRVKFEPCNKDTAPFTVLVYIATENNNEYLGPASLDSIARQVAQSRGPSGCNVEYVMNLAQTMRQTVPHTEDKHLYGLEDKLREIMASLDPASLVCTTCEYHSALAGVRQNTDS